MVVQPGGNKIIRHKVAQNIRVSFPASGILDKQLETEHNDLLQLVIDYC